MTSAAIVERLGLAMRVWSIGGLAMVVSVLSPLFVGVSVTPLAVALCGVLVVQSVIAVVAAAAFRRHFANGSEPAPRRALVALGIWLVIAAVVTLAFTLGLHVPNLEGLQ